MHIGHKVGRVVMRGVGEIVGQEGETWGLVRSGNGRSSH